MIPGWSYSKFSEKVAGAFQKIDLRILIFVLLCLNFLSFQLTDNEETQLSLAKQFMDPSWMPNTFMLNEWSGNRLLYQIISGFFLRHMQYETLVFFGRMCIFILVSIPVAAILKKLEFKNLVALILFQFYLIHQNFFGAEFLFGDFEVKCMSYIFVMYGLYFLLVNKYLWAIFFSVVASYFHILAGGWFFILIFIYLIVTKIPFKIIWKGLLQYILLMSPFIIYLSSEIFGSGSVINGINIDWVYVFYRNAHHTAPLSVAENLPRTLFQISVTLVLFLLTVLVFRKYKGEYLNKLFTLNVIVFSMLFLSIPISLFDKTGALLKFYLFRIAALGCFMMYLYVFLLLRLIPKISLWIKSAFVILGFYAIIALSASTYDQIFNADPKPEFNELVNYVRLNTEPSDIIFNLGDYDLSFLRKTKRELFVVYKFVPFGGIKIYEWYTRILDRQHVSTDISYLSVLKQKYRLNYLLSDHVLDEQSSIKLVYQNKKYWFYKII